MLYLFLLRNVLHTTITCTFSISEPPKVARTYSVLYFFTSKCTSYHNDMYFFVILTSKNHLTLKCFAHFDF